MTLQTEPSLDRIRTYYGKVLASQADLRTGACCAADAAPAHLRGLLARVHPEVQDRFYGCGVPIPPILEGATVLDLGCGAGRDCFVLSQLVGPEGRVIGVDMTEEQLEVARRHLEGHARAFGHERPNVEFRHGYMEELGELGIGDASVDVVVSNCVFNLSPDKPRLFREILRVLRPGGELFFSDVFADRRIPAPLRDDPVLMGECLSGALYTEDFRRLLQALGCADVRQVAERPVEIGDPELEARIGMVRFSSRTFRVFRIELEDRCEDYGQVVRYRGTIPELPHAFELDDHHRFEAGRRIPVCGNTARMLSRTRYAPHFELVGDESVHYGLFDCGPGAAGGSASEGGVPGACC